MISRWKRECKFKKRVLDVEGQEFKNLKKELMDVKEERDILKKVNTTNKIKFSVKINE